jgi:hypothetical protein
MPGSITPLLHVFMASGLIKRKNNFAFCLLSEEGNRSFSENLYFEKKNLDDEKCPEYQSKRLVIQTWSIDIQRIPG